MGIAITTTKRAGMGANKGPALFCF
jgi:hypothetical protein